MMLRAMSSVSSRRASTSSLRERPPPSRPSFGRWCSSYDQTASVYAPVIGIFRSCLRGRLEERELVVVVRLAERDRARGRGLRVVLVVERAHRAARLEAVRVGDRPRVHLAALLLAVPDPRRRRPTPGGARSSGSPSGRSRPGRARPAGGARRAARSPRRRPSRPSCRACSMSLSSSGLPAEVFTSHGGFASEPTSCVRNLTSPFVLTQQPPSLPSSPCRAAPSFSRATCSETYWRSPFGTRAISLHPALVELLDEGRDLARLLEHRAARVEDAGEEQLVEALGDAVARASRRSRSRSRPRAGRRALRRAGAARRRTSARARASGPPASASSASATSSRSRARPRARGTAPRARRARRRSPSSCGFRTPSAIALGVDAGSVRERKRRRQRHEARRRAEARRTARRAAAPSFGASVVARGSAVEGVRVEKARQGAGLEPVGRLDERPEDVLPAEHPVREEVEPRLLLDRDELGEVALDLLVDRLGRRAPAVEVARRLDERLGARVEPRHKSLQLSHDRPPPAGSPRA